MKCLKWKETSSSYRLSLSQRLLYYAYSSIILGFILISATSLAVLYSDHAKNIDFYMLLVGGILFVNIIQSLVFVNLARRIRQFEPELPVKSINVVKL